MVTQRGGLHRPTARDRGRCRAARRITIDGEAVVVGPDGLAQFEARARPWLDRKAALADLLRGMDAGIVLNEHIATEGAVVFAHACRIGAEGIVSKRIDAPYRSGPHPAWIKTKSPAAIAVQRQRSEIWNKCGLARWPSEQGIIGRTT
jgi:ATP-dependent DNA ligase